MMNREIRTRFAPSPTGGLHLGGARTALYSYLFAKQHQGSFLLRIEDTDQNRFVEGAEQYIFDCLDWCGLTPDEGPVQGGSCAPYRQSERRERYRQYALQLVEHGHAYYAFDTTDELEAMRERLKTPQNPQPQYDGHTRMHMKNSLALPADETNKLLLAGTPYVIRIKMPKDEVIVFQDMIRGEIHHEAGLVDDKVLLKADGMPTYHLAVVVDDYLMNITHAFRGEEWLPSAPVHVLLWRYLGLESHMPQWAHLPLILKPDGHGKLSKRDGDRLGFPVFAMDWQDPRSGEAVKGFREMGFMPEAFVNMLALLGWNSGEEKELFTMQELIESFSMQRVHKSGARFDFEKAKWFNHEWMKKTDPAAFVAPVKALLERHDIQATDDTYLLKIISLVKDRCTVTEDFYHQLSYFYQEPETYDLEPLLKKWAANKALFFEHLQQRLTASADWTLALVETTFKSLAEELQIKAGELQLPFRIMLVGGSYGPGVFQIAEIIGQAATLRRIQHTLSLISKTP